MMGIKKCMPPFVIRGFLDANLLKKIRNICENIKEKQLGEVDENEFFRRSLHNHPTLNVLHKSYVEPRACQLFKEELKASYVYTSLYDTGKGFCPVHTDRPQCYRTIDVCVNQKRPWPIYVLSQLDHPELDLENEESIKKLSEEFILEPGDALLYSGTEFPHWRNKIQPDNFCDLVFFHFVNKNFEGSLD